MKVAYREGGIVKVWLPDLGIFDDEKLAEQIDELVKLPFLHRYLALMPDVHLGYGVPIGSVLALRDVIMPNAVGVDIGCSVSLTKLSIKKEEIRPYLQTLSDEIRKEIPVGPKNRNVLAKRQSYGDYPFDTDNQFIGKDLVSDLNELYGYALGTLGGGNHFIEFQTDDFDNVYVMIHSGSRGIGYKIAQFYHALAVEKGVQWASSIPKVLAFFPVDSPEGIEYKKMHDKAMQFAKESHMLMHEIIFDAINRSVKADIVNHLYTHHNFAEIETHKDAKIVIHRKGAIKIQEKQFGLVPGSMGTKSYVVQGLGSKEAFDSCSHGAGRKFSRRKARETLSVEAEQSQMKDVVIDGFDLSEAPGAYKDIDEVISYESDLVQPVTILSPLMVIKG